MEFRKEIIRNGVYTYINPNTGLPERLHVTPETVKHYHDQGKEMLAAGLSIPVPLEHQPDAKPMTFAEKAAANLRNLAGDTKRYELGKVKENGVDKDALFAVVDVTDGGIADKIKAGTLKWVSPWINSFVDGAGRAWNNVVSHIALTATPRITKQTPFESVSAAMSLVNGMGDKNLGEAAKSGFALSRAGLLTSKENKLVPMFPVALSVMTGIKLAKEEFEEIMEDEDGEEEVTTETETPSDPVVNPAVPDMDADGVVGDQDDIAIHDVLADLLRMLDIKLPSGTNASNFERGLYEALMAAVKNLGGKIGGDEPQELGMVNDKPADDGQKNPVIQEQPPMYMSTQAIEQHVKDPEQRRLHAAMLSLYNENQSAKKAILDDKNRARMARIESIAKRLPVDKRDRFLKLVTAPSAALSLSNGQVIDPMEDMIQLHAELANAISGPDGTTKVEDHPPDGVRYDAGKYEKAGYLPAKAG